MNILVTGASGFIGRRLCARLKSLGHHVFGLSLHGPSDHSLGLEDHFQQDITKSFTLDRHFELVVHLAAYNITHIGAKDEGIYAAVNVEGTRNLLQAVSTKRFVYLSTAKVYKNEGMELYENSALAPQAPYEQSKLKAEEVCRASFKKESLVILRSVNCLGWGQAAKAVLPVFFQKAKTGQALDIMSSPRTPMQFVSVEDLVDAIEALILRESISGIFNVAHEDTFTIEQLARIIIKMTHSSSVLNISQEAVEKQFSPVNCDRAHKFLGWKAKTELSKILEFYQREYDRTA